MPKVRKAKDCLDIFTFAERTHIFGDMAIDDPKVHARIQKILQKTQMNKYQAKLQAVKVHDILGRLEADPSWRNQTTGEVGTNPGKALTGLLVHPFKAKYAGVSVETRKNAILQQYQSPLADTFETFRPRATMGMDGKGFRPGFEVDPAGSNNMVRAVFALTNKAFAKSIDDPQAMAFAKAWLDVVEKMRNRYNKAGGHMTSIEHWMLPQRHDPSLVGKVDFNTWYRDIKDSIDRTIFTNEFDEILPEEEFKAILEKVYMKIKTDGISSMEPGTPISRTSMFEGSVHNRYGRKRTLVFKDADAWLKYHEKYGLGTPWGAMQTHMERMSRDIALMETLGPDPDAVFKLFTDVTIKKTGRTIPAAFAGMVYKNLTNRVHSEGNPWFDAFHIARNVETALRLGYAPVAAVGDVLFSGLTAHYNGMSAIRLFKRQFANLSPETWRENRQLATRLMLGANYALDRMNSNVRYADASGYEKVAWAADTSVRASGLNRWTNIGRASFGLENANHMAEVINRFHDWDSVPRRFKNALERYGIDAKDWERLRGSEQLDYHGVKYIDPTKFGDDELVAKFIGMVSDETNFAVPEANTRTRAILNLGTSDNTVVGETIRLFGQFKAFPVTAATMHLGRVFGPMENADRMAYASSLVIGGTVLGTMVVQAREVMHGRGLRDWDDPGLWSIGFAQSGVLGPLGDLLFRDNSHQMHPISSMLVGPVISEFDTLARNAYSATGKMMDGDPNTDPMQNLANILARVTPLDNWYTHLVLQNMIRSHLLQAVDPTWRHRKTRMNQKLMRDRPQDEPWWEPYQPTPGN